MVPLDSFQLDFQLLFHLLVDGVLKPDHGPYHSPLMGWWMDVNLGRVLGGGQLVHVKGLKCLQQVKWVLSEQESVHLIPPQVQIRNFLL